MGRVEEVLKVLESKAKKKMDTPAKKTKKAQSSSEEELSSGAEDGSDGDGGSDEISGGGGDDLDSDDMAEFAATPLCAPFKRDVNAVEHVFGSDAVKVQHAVGDDVSVTLDIPIDTLSDRVMEAWGLQAYQPIHCQLKDMSASDYMRAGVPKVKVWQDDFEGAQYRGGVLAQIERIATEWLKDEWKAFHTTRSQQYYQDWKGSVGQSGPALDAKEQQIAKQLMEMGVNRKLAEDAAQQADSLEEAIAIATDDPGKIKKAAPKGKGLFGGSGANKKQASTATTTKSSNLKKVESFAHKYAAEAEEKKREFQVTPQNGFLVGVYEYLGFRLKNLHLYCPLCDCGHLFGSPMLKPACCTRDLCAFAFNQLGLMKDTVDGVATQAAVVDLLVTLAKAAATSARHTAVFNPFPQVPDPDKPDVFALDPAAPDYTLAKDAVCSISMARLTFQDTGKAPVAQHRLATAVLSWIVASNRSYLVKLPPEKELESMASHHQFLMLSASPEQEEEFAQLKEKHGSVFAFHGSRSENWHSILRQGLRNASGTKLQLNGAAYGAGIYLSPAASLSLGYSQMYNYGVPKTNNTAGAPGDQPGEFLDGSNFCCIAICEVINHGIKKHNATIWTVAEEKHVVTRFFVVYPPGTNAQKAHGANTESAQFLKEIHNALAVDSVSSLTRSRDAQKKGKK